MSAPVAADSLTAAHAPDSDSELGVRRLNRLPLVLVSVLCVLLLAVLVFAGFQRAEQNRSGVRIGGGFDQPLEPVEAEQAAQTLLRDYREPPDPAELAGMEWEALGLPVPPLPSHHEPVRAEPLPGGAPPLDRFAEQRRELAHDAHRAPTVVPTDDLYRDADAETAPEQAFDTQTPPDAFGLAGDAADPNLRTRKALFKRTERKYGYSSEPRRPALSPFVVRVGSVIPAVLIGGINSDLPGEIVAQVSHDVRDSRTGRYVLIPRGTQLVGRYDHHIAMGQRRLLTVWHRLRFPDDSTLDLGGMSGTDPAGFAGFRDNVNNHYPRIFGSATLLALVGAGMQLAIPSSSDDDEDEDPAEALQVETARQWGALGREVARKNLTIQPTLEIRPGYRFNVLVDQDLILPPYSG